MDIFLVKMSDSTSLYYFIGDKGDYIVPDGIRYIERPSSILYSPRISNSNEDQINTSTMSNTKETKVYFCTRGTKEDYPDIYAFVFACRASKLTENYYLIGIPSSVEDLQQRATKLGGLLLYNIVSGDKLPQLARTSESIRRLIHHYMLMGLHYLNVYYTCGLGDTQIIQEQNQSRIISAGGHVFESNQGWVLNVSNIFIGSLIDYYRIESGIIGMNAQLSFVKEPEYRYLVYKYLRSVFIAFIKNNSTTEQEISEQTDDDDIILYAARIIGSLIE